MNAVSTAVQRYDYARSERRTGSVVAVNRPRDDNRFRDHLPGAAVQDNTVYGEIVDSEPPGTHLRVRGMTLEGRINSTHDAIASYRMHQFISPATVSTPGRLLDALA